jgi:hypothetical protein
MPEKDGLQVITELMSHGEPKPRIIVMTTYESEGDVRRALQAGAKGYLVKGAEALYVNVKLESGVATPLNPRMVARTETVPVVSKWHWTPQDPFGDLRGRQANPGTAIATSRQWARLLLEQPYADVYFIDRRPLKSTLDNGLRAFRTWSGHRVPKPDLRTPPKGCAPARAARTSDGSNCV